MPGARGRIRVLHLEDNPQDAELISRRLKACGFDCEVVRAEGRQAFEAALAAGAFDLVLSDYDVPGYGGLSAMKWTRERQPDLPFIILSGALREEEAVECIRAGATDYLLKDRLQRLCLAVERALVEVEDRRRRRQAEQALREKEALFRGILEAAPDAVIMSREDGRVVMANLAAERIFGYPREALARMSIEDLVPESRRERHAGTQTGYPPEPAVRRTAGSRPLEGMRADGTRVPLEIGLSRLPAPSGMLVVSIARDVTERMEMEQRLRQSQKMEAVGQLTGGVAHDFNNLLGVILGNLDLLEQVVATSEEALRRVNIAQRAAARGADLTKRLLAFSRRQRLHPTAVSIAECAGNVFQMARRTLGADVEIVRKVPEDLPPVLADASSLENVLLNLMINSRDAMPHGGAITVAARLADLDDRYPGVQAGEIRPGRYVCATVTDAGHGMPPEVLQRVFEPFFTTKARGKGTGLGLAMVYGFMRQSGGHVSIYSEVGHGTTVKLYLPLAEPGAASAAESDAGAEPARIQGTVLVVDDEVDLLDVAVAYLEEMGFRVLHAMDGPEAIKVLEGEPSVDLLVTDIMMPGGMNGVELARRVRAERPGIRVMYSTGFSSGALSQRDGTAVDGPVLSKPYRRGEFFAAVRRAMASSPNGAGGSDDPAGGGN